VDIIGKWVAPISILSLAEQKYILLPENWGEPYIVDSGWGGIVIHYGYRKMYHKIQEHQKVISFSSFYLKTIHYSTDNYVVVKDCVIKWFKERSTITSISDTTIIDKLILF